MTRVKIGFVVNPIAGIGGTVGLKGSDGYDVQREAKRRGAHHISPLRAQVALNSLKVFRTDLQILTSGEEMGESELKACGLNAEVIHRPRSPTTKEDTKASVAGFLHEGVELVVFVGGDGTARDVLEVVDRKVPIIGVPSGVKMHSSAFLNRPEDLGDVLSSFARARAVKDAEVMDIDEDLFRTGIVKAKLLGLAKTPDDNAHVQNSKASYDMLSVEDEAREIGQYVAESMSPEYFYILGPGTTTSFIAESLGVKKTLLGVDVISAGKVVISDATENDLLRLLESPHKAIIIVSPIGSQGFFLGRGNQQISAKVIRAVGADGVMVIATPTKLRDTKILRVDSGDPEVDGWLKGKIKVVTGYKRKRLVEVR